MSRVTLDADLKAKLHGLTDQLELCDPDGRTMGRCIPEELYQKLLYRLAESQRPILSAEEIERRRKTASGKSLADILNNLGAP
jgi:hypothetical protein